MLILTKMKQQGKVKEESKKSHPSSHYFGEHLSSHLCMYMRVVCVHTYPPQLYIKTHQYLPTLIVLVCFLSEYAYCQL